MVKPLISLSSELGVSSGSEEEGGWWKESEGEADAICLCCAGLFFEDHNGEEWGQCQKCLKWTHTLCERSFVCMTSVKSDIHLFIVAAKC